MRLQSFCGRNEQCNERGYVEAWTVTGASHYSTDTNSQIEITK